MKNLKHCFTLACSVLLILGLPVLAQAQGEHEEDLVGWWTFEKGNELVDLTGNFGDIEPRGATVSDGMLNIGNNEWALTEPTEYSGPDIVEKTLVAWAYLDDLAVRNGALLAINQSSSDSFDAIVYAERQPNRWMAGSSNFSRTNDFDPGFEEKASTIGDLIQIAISYEDDGGAHVIGYRNGEVIGDYTKGALATWVAGNTEALFGPRALIGGTAYGWVIARLEDARIYGAVLDQKDIKALRPDSVSVEALGKLTTLWGAVKAE